VQTVLIQRRASTAQELQAVSDKQALVLAVVADAQPVDFSAMAQLQQFCPEVASMLTSNSLHIISQAVSRVPLMGDVLTGVFCSLVPARMREAVFQSLHSFLYPRVWATQRLITARFCWPQMAKAITLMARACLYNRARNVELQPATILVPHRHFAHIHVDLVRPLLPSRGHTYLFCDRQDFSVAGDNPTLNLHKCRLHQRPFIRLNLPFWGASHHHI